MLLSLFALTLATTPAAAAPHAANDAAEAAGVAVVFLNCQVGDKTLTDCRVVNEGPVDATAAAQAVKMAEAMAVPAALAERNPGRIMLKLNVQP
ncbi:MAG: hypothetical protein JSR86_02000 [Proteobacteria bacterium]|nr:hypothetical protein [Pseudomonadota bacterium]